MAISRKTGARGLRGIIEKLLLDVMFEIPGNVIFNLYQGKFKNINFLLPGSNVESVEVTKEAVTGMSAPTFYYAEVRPKAPKIRYVVDMMKPFNWLSLL